MIVEAVPRSEARSVASIGREPLAVAGAPGRENARGVELGGGDGGGVGGSAERTGADSEPGANDGFIGVVAGMAGRRSLPGRCGAWGGVLLLCESGRRSLL